MYDDYIIYEIIYNISSLNLINVMLYFDKKHVMGFILICFSKLKDVKYNLWN